VSGSVLSPVRSCAIKKATRQTLVDVGAGVCDGNARLLVAAPLVG
jgi:hypothetical protein